MTAHSIRVSGDESRGHDEKPRTSSRILHLRGMTFALTGLFLLALFYTLYFARDLVMPLVLAVLVSFPLTPIVRALKRLGIPHPAGAAFVVFGFLTILAGSAYHVYEPAVQWMSTLPGQLRDIEYKLRDLGEPVQQVSQAADEVEEQVTEIANGEAEPDPVPVVVDRRPALSDLLLSGTRRFLVMTAVVLILLYFLLASGDLFLLKIVRVLPKLEDKKRAVEISRRVEQHISSYLLTVSAINVALGVVVATVMYMLGMPNPLLWGVMATVFNFVPYLGALTGVIVLGLVAMATFDSLGQALLIPAVYYGLTVTEGYFLTPLILGRRLTLNPVVIIIFLLFWVWLWGIPGALLAVPILATVKILCDEVEGLRPIAEFLGP